MNLPEFSVHRPVFITMVFLMTLVIGAVALSRLKIDMLPEIEMPTLSIRTEFNGASPEIMERQVTRVIEEIVSTVPGVEEITSDSSEGNSNVQVRFTWDTDIDLPPWTSGPSLRMNSMNCPMTLNGPNPQI